MIRKHLFLLMGLLLLACLLAGCGRAAEVSAATAESRIGETIPDSPGGSRLEIPALHGSICLPAGYYAFGEDIPYTEQMCRDIGLEPENVEKAIPLLSGQIMIVRSDEPYTSDSMTIYLKVKEKKYEDLTLSAVSDSEYRLYASTIVGSFGVREYETMEGNGLRFFVFSHEAMGHVCRCATILNGHMIYVYANTGTKPITEEQRAVLTGIALSMQSGL